MDYLVSWLFFVLGAAAVVLNKFVGRTAVAWQRFLTGKEYDEIVCRGVYIVLGMFSAIFGLAAAFGAIKFGPR
jgi:hypothetical protein